jgi:hypothetical protein
LTGATSAGDVDTGNPQPLCPAEPSQEEVAGNVRAREERVPDHDDRAAPGSEAPGN